ncbi:MAG TPA: hypothetical protein VK586_19190 [Streptosporangiaceae bacterium]|nr:hypothetical protein [Streptosporangiaceae bacterium]
MLRLTSGAGADLVLESAGGATFGASLAAARGDGRALRAHGRRGARSRPAHRI